ncbi:MAG: hypothetical protein M3O22_05110 [Pseudomonadota bacterium]|nr:hypothetical protein [Pseudomonadota bacterium]
MASIWNWKKYMREWRVAAAVALTSLSALAAPLTGRSAEEKTVRTSSRVTEAGTRLDWDAMDDQRRAEVASVVFGTEGTSWDTVTESGETWHRVNIKKLAFGASLGAKNTPHLAILESTLAALGCAPVFDTDANGNMYLKVSARRGAVLGDMSRFLQGGPEEISLALENALEFERTVTTPGVHARRPSVIRPDTHNTVASVGGGTPVSVSGKKDPTISIRGSSARSRPASQPEAGPETGKAEKSVDPALARAITEFGWISTSIPSAFALVLGSESRRGKVNSGLQKEVSRVYGLLRQAGLEFREKTLGWEELKKLFTLSPGPMFGIKVDEKGNVDPVHEKRAAAISERVFIVGGEKFQAIIDADNARREAELAEKDRLTRERSATRAAATLQDSMVSSELREMALQDMKDAGWKPDGGKGYRLPLGRPEDLKTGVLRELVDTLSAGGVSYRMRETFGSAFVQLPGQDKPKYQEDPKRVFFRMDVADGEALVRMFMKRRESTSVSVVAPPVMPAVVSSGRGATPAAARTPTV